MRNAREALHITQAKLAEYADISLSYLTDIERCKTWVSDKTLRNIAKALNKKAYELLIPLEGEPAGEQENQSRILEEIAGLINEKKLALRKASDEAMDDLMVQIIRLYSKD